MIPTKEMTPHAPISVSEIIEDVHLATEIGITMVHLHAREQVTGIPTYKKEEYCKIIEDIRKYAPYLRYNSYELLDTMGRELKCSITDYFNKSSLRFKKKLNSKHLRLYIHFKLFKKYNKHTILKDYP